MTELSEAPRVLTLDPDGNWSGALKGHFRLRGVDYEQAGNIDDAIELLNSGDFTAVITDGLKGEWRRVVEEADKLDVRPVVLSNSTMAVHKIQAQKVIAFHTRRSLSNGEMDTITRVATRPNSK